jgi:hypothetical protein
MVKGERWYAPTDEFGIEIREEARGKLGVGSNHETWRMLTSFNLKKFKTCQRWFAWA